MNSTSPNGTFVILGLLFGGLGLALIGTALRSFRTGPAPGPLTSLALAIAGVASLLMAVQFVVALN